MKSWAMYVCMYMTTCMYVHVQVFIDFTGGRKNNFAITIIRRLEVLTQF